MEEEKKDRSGPGIAVALGFEEGDETPRVLASGHGRLAEKIVEEARKADIPLHKDAGLADTLSKLDLGEYIPPELYQVVVDVLTYVDRIDSVKAKIAQNNKKD